MCLIILGGGYAVSFETDSLQNCAYYGLLECPWGDGRDTLEVGGYYSIKYARWCASSVFYIPRERGESEVLVNFRSPKNIKVSAAYFYEADLDALGEAVFLLRKKSEAIKNLSVQNGFVSADVFVPEGASLGKPALFLSVPVHEGWRVTVNGKRVKAGRFADCLYSVPLEAGACRVEMRFLVPGARCGLVLSLAAFFVLLGMTVCRKQVYFTCYSRIGARE